MATLETNSALIATLTVSATTSLALLKKPSPPSSSPSSLLPSLADIRNDVLSLLQLTAKEITALSLALKPPASHDALEQTLAKVQQLEAKLRFAGEQLPDLTQGVLAKRIKSVSLSCLLRQFQQSRDRSGFWRGQPRLCT